jgi:hypothetical protein
MLHVPELWKGSKLQGQFSLIINMKRGHVIKSRGTWTNSRERQRKELSLVHYECVSGYVGELTAMAIFVSVK